MATTITQIFESHLLQWNTIINEALQSPNAAMHLYTNGARNTIFKLEALCRLHENVLKNDKIAKWTKRFRDIEDQLGAIDYRDNMLKLFELSKDFPKPTLLKQKEIVASEIDKLNATLQSKKWISNNCKKLIKLLNKENVIINSTYTQNLHSFIVNEIDAIVQFYNTFNNKITQIEEGIHEMRRKLRWLSIYAQSLHGIIQLKKTTSKNTWSKTYLLPEIIKSPFNKLPKPINNIEPIYFAYNNFIALSSIINSLGNLKDKGLQFHFLKNECKLTALKTAKIIGKTQLTEEKILQNATKLCNHYFKNNILQTMVLM